MIRSILAIIIGYLAIAGATTICVILLSLAYGLPLDPNAPAPKPPTSYIVVNLILGVPCAMLGGFVAALIGHNAPRRHALILGVILLLLGIGYALFFRTDLQPTWYLILLPIAGALGATSGGLLRRRSGVA